jgi:MFS family permease
VPSPWFQVLGIGFVEIAWTATVATLPLLALRTQGGAAVAGWLLAAYGAGSLAGGLLSARARATGGHTALIAVVTAAGVSWLLLLPLAWWAIALVVGANGVCAGLFFPRFFAALTTRTPAELRGRVMTSATVAASAPAPLGFLGAGLLSEATGTPTASLVLVAAAATVGAAVIAWSRRPGATQDPEHTPATVGSTPQ